MSSSVDAYRINFLRNRSENFGNGEKNYLPETHSGERTTKVL